MPNVHFIGICGTAMSAVALLLKQRGYEVSGSDEGFYPPISDYLRQAGIPFVSGYKAENIPQDVQMIVIGKHARLVPEENPEVAAAFASGIRIASYPDVLEELTVSSENLVVAGSFGKSTSTALMAWILVQAQCNPSYMVGALSPSLAGNAVSGTGNYFVLEGDEYPSANWDQSSKFLHYHTDHLLLTSCEHDHFNVFPTLADYLQPFSELVAQPRIRQIVACLDGAHIQEVVHHAQAPVAYYSLDNSEAYWYAADIKRSAEGTSFMLMANGRELVRLSTKLLGDHNIMNIIGVAALLLLADSVTLKQVADGVATFAGVRRRLELLSSTNQVPLYEDFGSSRAKLVAGIRAVRQQFPERRIHVVFEPHTFSFRSRAALDWYNDMFNEATDVYVFQPPKSGPATDDQISQAEIVQQITKSGTKASAFNSKEELLTLLSPLDPKQDVVLIETSGEIGGAIPFLREKLN